MTRDQLRGRIMLVGVTPRWMGADRIRRRACDGGPYDLEAKSAMVRELLEELTLAGRIETKVMFGRDVWRTRR